MRRRIAALILAPALLLGSDGVLEIIPVEGEHAVHDSRRGKAAPTVVEVRDQNGRLAAGAQVRFLAPEFGPSGRFAGGARDRSVITGEDGRAVMTGFTPNTQEGPFSLVVTARAAGADNTIVLRHANRAGAMAAQPGATQVRAGKSSGLGKKLLVVLGVGAAVTAVSVASAGGGSSSPGSPGSPSAPPVSITLGDISVGPPK